MENISYQLTDIINIMAIEIKYHDSNPGIILLISPEKLRVTI
ncbi:hypothetical protein XBO1_1240064 [Xenorhabdus bovienii str. oregonense]|uniref:Uncharacterized protein n=1 Tax=Xenorhabdus bovienii str. oregonense TaxID=1398202 RepID=A0A077P0W7_XENBV|nr:hypothetical protein XBO1_1240064 [Xenorhabdus bovienii str. oregonense]